MRAGPPERAGIRATSSAPTSNPAPAGEETTCLPVLGRAGLDQLLVLSHGTADFIPPEVRDRVTGVYSKATAPLVGRSRAEVRRFLDGLEVLEPGVVTVPLWRPEGEPADGAERVSMYGAVARKA